MCRSTKQRIAQPLRELMQQRPLRKMTVQDLMEKTQMKRQSFYDHFQDIPDVLCWICEQQLAAPLRRARIWILRSGASGCWICWGGTRCFTGAFLWRQTRCPRWFFAQKPGDGALPGFDKRTGRANFWKE